MYMRVSVLYRIANGDAATTSTVLHPIQRRRTGSSPPSRRPARNASGSITTPSRPESARTATSDDPKTWIQPWSTT